MAWTDLGSTFVYKLLLTYQLMDQIAEDLNLCVRTDLGGQTITPASAVVGLTIDQNFDSYGCRIDSENSSPGLYVTAKRGGLVVQDVSGGYGLYVGRNLNETGTYPLVTFIEDHTASTQAVLEIQNDGTGEEIKFTNAVTRYYSIPPAAFVTQQETYDWYITYSLIKNRAVLGNQTFLAPVNLPHGAVVTAIAMYYYRDDSLSSIASWLYRISATGISNEMAYVNGGSIAGNATEEDTSILLSTIDNLSYTYCIVLTIAPNNSVDDCYAYGFRITYTIQEPLP